MWLYSSGRIHKLVKVIPKKKRRNYLEVEQQSTETAVVTRGPYAEHSDGWAKP